MHLLSIKQLLLAGAAEPQSKITTEIKRTTLAEYRANLGYQTSRIFAILHLQVALLREWSLLRGGRTGGLVKTGGDQ